MATTNAAVGNKDKFLFTFPGAKTIVRFNEWHEDAYGTIYHFRLLDGKGIPYPYVFSISRRFLNEGFFSVCSLDYDREHDIQNCVGYCIDRGVMSWLALLKTEKDKGNWIGEQTVPVRTDEQATAEFAKIDAGRKAEYDARIAQVRENHRRLGKPFPADRIFKFMPLEEAMARGRQERLRMFGHSS